MATNSCYFCNTTRNEITVHSFEKMHKEIAEKSSEKTITVFIEGNVKEKYEGFEIKYKLISEKYRLA